MGKRGNGEDSIYRDGDRWRGAISLGFDAAGKRIRKKVSAKTREGVVKEIRRARKLLESGLLASDEKLTVAAYLERWLESGLRHSIDESTFGDYVNQVRLHLIPGLGKRALTKLTVADCDGLWRMKREQGYAANSVRLMRSTLRKALGQAEREGLVPRNVAALSAPQKLDTSEGRSLTAAQAKTILAAVVDHRLEALFLILLTYGLRRGEGLGLHWSALDWEARTLRITHSVKRVKETDPATQRKTRLIVGSVKTKRSRRTLFLTEPVIAALRRREELDQQERDVAGDSWTDFGLIFPSLLGTPHDPQNFSHTFSALCRRAGLGHWHPHELRHSGASLMLAQKVPLEVVSEILGHASIAITKDVYGHLIEGQKRNAAELMSDALCG